MCKLLTFNSKIPVHFILFLGVLKYKKKKNIHKRLRQKMFQLLFCISFSLVLFCRSSLEAMLDTFAVHGARPRCNPSPPKRQHLGMPPP